MGEFPWFTKQSEITKFNSEQAKAMADKPPTLYERVHRVERPVTYTPYASEHDLIYGYVYACFLNGHGAEPWLVRPLSAWTGIAEAELERRGLLKKANRVYRILLKQHHADNPDLLFRDDHKP